MTRRILTLLASLALLVACAASAAAQAVVVEYYHLDALGSVRVVTDQAGQVIARHDFLPFGEEWNPPANGKEKKLFTGHERDAETGLDYFGARYYRAQVGRFTTIDPVYTWSENLADPQRWNRYAYVRNNPLKFVDLDGRETVLLFGLRTDSNLFGHVAIAINGKVFSFGTNWTNGEKSVKDWGRDEGTYLDAQSDKRETNRVTLDISDAQESALLKSLTQNNPNAGRGQAYDAVTNSCVAVSEQAMESTGILSTQYTTNARGEEARAGSFTPDGLAARVNDAGLVRSATTVGHKPKNSWLGTLWNMLTK